MEKLVNWTVIGAISFVGSWVGGRLLNAPEKASAEITQVQINLNDTNERVAKLEEAVITIKDDNKEMKSDIKQLLRFVGVKPLTVNSSSK